MKHKTSFKQKQEVVVVVVVFSLMSCEKCLLLLLLQEWLTMNSSCTIKLAKNGNICVWGNLVFLVGDSVLLVSVSVRGEWENTFLSPLSHSLKQQGTPLP